MTTLLNPLTGGVLAASPAAAGTTDTDDLRRLVDDIVRRNAVRGTAGHRLDQDYDRNLWVDLHDAGLTALTRDSDAGPAALSTVLWALARHCSSIPLAETDLLGAWLAGLAGIDYPAEEPLTVAMGSPQAHTIHNGSITADFRNVPWLGLATLLLAIPVDGHLLVTKADGHRGVTAHNLAGEPRGCLSVDLPLSVFSEVDPAAMAELMRRGAWARCVQTVGALDTAAQSSVAYTRQRVQFGRTLNAFQAVQHALANMAGEIERGRAATGLAIAAAADHGFGSPQADYAVTLAKVTMGQVVPVASRTAHQLHGAVGVTLEHNLWRATMRARSWIDEFGNTLQYARRLGRIALRAQSDGCEPWDDIFGIGTQAWR